MITHVAQENPFLFDISSSACGGGGHCYTQTNKYYTMNLRPGIYSTPLTSVSSVEWEYTLAVSNARCDILLERNYNDFDSGNESI